MNTIRLHALRALALGVLLLAAPAAHAAPRAFITATNCQVSSLVGAPENFLGFRLAIDCMQPNLGLYVNSKITLTCDQGALDLYWGMPSSSTSGPSTLFLAQINNSLNLGKRIQAITYYAYSYAFVASPSDTCQEQRALLGLSTSGTANVLVSYKL